MKLLNDELIKTLPPLYSTENNKDPLVLCKFFTLIALGVGMYWNLIKLMKYSLVMCGFEK